MREMVARAGASRLGGFLLSALAALVTLGSGLWLGRALMSPEWTQAVTLVGLTAAGLLVLLAPGVGLLAWILLAPYTPHIYLRLEFGSGIPNLDLGRLATLFLAYLLVARTIWRPAVTEPTWRPPRPGWTEALMAAFTAVMGLSVLSGAGGLLAGIQNVFDFVAMPYLVYLFARTWLRSSRGVAGMVGVVALAGALMGFITTREQLTGQAVFSPVFYTLEYEQNIRLVMSLFGHPSTIAMALAISVPLLIYGIRFPAVPQMRIWMSLALGVTLAGVFFAYMRAGWLGALVGLIVPALLNRELRRMLLPLAPLLVLVVVLAVSFGVDLQTVQARLTSEAPIIYRFMAWQIAWELFKSSPFLGIGWNQFGQAAATLFGWNPHVILSDLPSPHNTYLNVLITGGILGLVPYLGVLASLILTGWRFWRHKIGRETVAVLWATVLAYMAIIASFDAFNAQYANMLFFLIVGSLVGRLEASAADNEALA